MLRASGLSLISQIRCIGSIRSAGGSIAKRGESIEEAYFRKKRCEQLEKLRLKMKQLEQLLKNSEKTEKKN